MKLLPVAAVFFVALLALPVGCGSDKNPAAPDLTTTAGLMDALQSSYRKKDAAAYADLLADDFRFYFDGTSRLVFDLPEFWSIEEERDATQKIFAYGLLRGVEIELTYTDPVPSGEVDRESWLRSSITDTHLELSLAPADGETESTTLIIDGQVQVLYLRFGKSPADTLAASPTAGRLYIVEWHDLGAPARRPDPSFSAMAYEPTPVKSVTWSTLKVLFRNNYPGGD